MTSLNEGVLTDALVLAQQQLQNFAQSENFWTTFDSVFGTEYDRAQTEAIQHAWQASNFSQLPEIQVLDSASMPGIEGGFSAQTGKIYINADFLANATADQIAAVLLEEIGHSLDAQINTTDTAGDEGELFANRVLGIALTDDLVSAIRAENDITTISANGQTISVEAATNNNASIISTSSIHLNTVDAGWYDQYGYHNPNNLNTYTGDIGNHELRSFFIFNQPYKFQSGILTGAKLSFYSYAIYTDEPQETLEIHQVNTAPNSLIQGTAGVSGFNDLGDGPTYGTYSFNSSVAYSYFQVSLSNSGLNYIQNTNSLIAFGGKLSNLTLNSQQEAIFWGSDNYSNATVILELNGVTATGAVTEDINVSTGQLSTTGKLAVSDLDPGQAKFSTVVTSSSGNLGALTITEGGTWSYNVNNNLVQSLGVGATKTESFTVKSFDGTANQNINIIITGVNDAPVGTATASLATGTEDTPYTIKVSDLLSGFSDVDGDTLSVVNLTATNGSLVNNNGTYTFTPNANFNGTVNLSYNVIDGKGGSVAATQSFAIAAVNDAPVLTGTPAILTAGTEDTAYTISAATLLQGYTDVDSAVLSVSNLAAANGTLANNNNGTWTFTPSANFNGTVNLTYNVIDGSGGSVPATRTLAIAAVNDAPTGSPTVTLTSGTEDTAYTINKADLLAGFSDVDGDSLSVNNLTANGVVLTADNNGNYVFTPPANFNGSVTLSYNIVDGKGGSVAANRTVAIAAVNDAPVVANAITTQNGTEDTAILFTIPANTFSDVDAGDTLTLSATLGDGSTLPAWLSFNATTRTFSGTPPQDFNGTLSLQVTATDSGNLKTSSTFDLAIAPVNDAPTLTAAQASLAVGTEDTVYTITRAQLLQGFSDVDADALSITNLAISKGTFVENVDGSFTITPPANYNGSVTVTYKVSDGSVSVDASNTFSLAAVNDAPTLTGAQVSLVAGTEDTSYTISVSNLLAGFSDVDGDTLSVANLSATNGSLVNNNGSWTFTPDTNFNGIVNLSYDVIDGKGGSVAATQSFTLIAVNDAPTLNATVTSFAYTDTQNNDNFAAFDGELTSTDPDGLAPSYGIPGGIDNNNGTISKAGLYGTLTVHRDTGAYTFTPHDAAIESLKTDASETFNLVVSGSNGGSDSKDLTIHLTGANDTPTISASLTDATYIDTANDDPFNVVTGQLNSSDRDAGDSATYLINDGTDNGNGTISKVGSYGFLTVNKTSGAYTFTPHDEAIEALKADVVETFTLQVTDGSGAVASQTLTINIAAVNDTASIGGATTGGATEDSNVVNGSLAVSGGLDVSDRDTGDARFSTTVVPAKGALGNLTITEAGAWSYNVANSAVQSLGQSVTKTETFTVTSIDGTATQEITVTLTGVNDAAVIGTPTVTAVTEDLNINGSGDLIASGSISIADADQDQAAFKTTVTKADGTLGNLVLAPNGTYTYSVDNSAVQFLGQGITKTETFTVESVDGTTEEVSFIITGVNDAAVIGAPSFGAVTEDLNVNGNGNLTASGVISISDADQNQAAFKTTVSKAQGTLGNLLLGSDGTYAYSVVNSAVQFLGAGQTKTETFAVESVDGTTQEVNFTITGVNDAAVISGNATASVKEDTNVTTGKLTAGNKLTVIDADQGEALFDTGVTFKNNSLNSAALGALSIDASGNFSYSVDNTKAQVQSLGVGQTITEMFAVKSKDGTASQDIAITINGTNDAPIAAAPSRLNQSSQYSDAIQEVIFTATDVDMGDTLAGSIAYSYNGGAFMNGLPDAGSVTGGLSFAFDAASNSWKLSGIADLTPGNYQFRFRATDSQGAFSDTLTALTVTSENATGINYSGPLFVTTPSKTNLTATIPLQALFEDVADGDRGNITQAKATFFLMNNGTETAINTSPVAVTQTTDLQHGLATYNWTKTLSGNNVSETYTIKVKANGFYTGESTEYAVVTLALPDGQFMTGGGTLGRQDALNPGYVGSLGQNADSLINFGFNTKYNKSNTNLQGNSNIIIRGQFDSDADIDHYQIKSNATDSLSVFGNARERATFLAKASLFDLDANVSLQGNLSLRTEVYDAGQTSSTTDVDQFGFTLTNASGNLLFATSLNNSGLLAMSGGNTAIH